MAGPFEHLHLKRNTKGSSNELSLDVLDAARTGAEMSDDKSSRFSRRIQGSYHGVSGTSTLSGQAEVEKKKQLRRRRNALTRALIAAVAIVAIAGIGWFVYTQYLGYKYFEESFDRLVTELIEEDSVIAELDKLISSPYESGKEEQRKSMSARIPEEKNSIQEIRSQAESATSVALSDKDKVAVNQMIKAAGSRLQMLESGGQILELAMKVDEEKKAVNKVWNNVLDADQQVRAATELSNTATTEEATQEARDATQHALESLSAVLQSIDDLDQDYEAIDLSDQEDYLSMRISSLKYAIATSDALIEGDREKAATQNEKYNEADQRAAQLAAAMPLSVSDVVERSHEATLAELQSAYKKARENTIESDKIIREYLGV